MIIEESRCRFKMDRKIGKIGFFTGLISFTLLIFGVRTLLGHELVLKNYMTFGIFSITVGFFATLLLFYQYRIAFRIFIIALILGFAELFRSFIMIDHPNADALGILSLFIISSFGLGIALIVQFTIQLLRKN